MIKTLSILLCYLIFASLPVFSQNIELNNKQNANTSSNIKNIDCTDYPVVSGLERKAFGSTFLNENIYNRVNSLENEILGTTFPQEALCDRIDRIAKAAASSDEYANSDTSPRQSVYQTTLSSAMQTMSNSFNNNSSYNNQFNSTQNTSALQKVLNFAMPFINGSNNSWNNSFYSPNFSDNYSGIQNSSFGAGVKILH